MKLETVMAPDWAEKMRDLSPQIDQIGQFLLQEKQQGRTFLPAVNNIFRAFTLPLKDVKVLIIGQDPYPTPGHPVGLSFSVDPKVSRLPASLRNIFQEMSTDLGCPIPTSGDLSPWVNQGVMLLNRVLTVGAGKPNSHQNIGWKPITQRAVELLNARQQPLVCILWGRGAQELAPLFTNPLVKVLKSAHPSPLSAHAGFFGSKPFSQTNQFLEAQGVTPINWQLPS
jgi:uracil-DNA glycosylase